jgi:hypothetical protein
MKLNVDTAEALGLIPLRVYDRNGNEIEERIIEFNTKTGEVTYVESDSRGNPIIQGDQLVYITKKYPAPLTWKSNKNSAE